MYMAAATLVCTVAIAADVVYAFKWKKFWFPSKYFTLNAASLTVLSVVTKLAVDLTTPMPKLKDQLAKIGNTMLVTTFMGNVVTSLGRMDRMSMLENMIALVILVITIIVDIVIEICTSLIESKIIIEQEFATVLMFIVLLMLIHLALTIPEAKNILQVKYRQVYKRIVNEEELSRERRLTKVKLKSVLKKLWMMAETSNPQFVVGRSIASASMAFLCLLNVLTYLEVCRSIPSEFQGGWIFSNVHPGTALCDYSWSMIVIFVMQSIALIVGSLRPFVRWCTFISIKYIEKQKSCKEEFKIETYWTETLVRWRKKPLPLRMAGRGRWKRTFQAIKNFPINLLFWFQILMVGINKFSIAISCFPVKPLFWCFSCIRNKCKKQFDGRKQESQLETELDLASYVLYLEGEVQLPRKALKMICYEVDKLIQAGKNVKPKNLIKLLQRSENFTGVNDFDQVHERLDHLEPPSSWALPVMTISTIVIALVPHAEIRSIEEFICGATEGLKYANLVDRALELKYKMSHIRKAVKVVWSGVELHHEWLEVSLKELPRGISFKETLLLLVDRAEITLRNFKNNEDGSLMDPLDWPSEIIAANSMYRTGKTLILAYEEGNFKNDDRKFQEKLYAMIADILSACLTNLPHVMIQGCLNCTIEERERKIRRAAKLFGETEEILELLEAREVPNMDCDKAMCINEWQALLSQKGPPSFNVTSNNGEASPSVGKHISIDVQP